MHDLSEATEDELSPEVPAPIGILLEEATKDRSDRCTSD